MLRAALIGLGKMGLSHLAIANAHPEVDLVAASDAAGYVIDAVEKYSGIKGYQDYRKMFDTENLDAVFIATPSRLHSEMVEEALSRNLHVFCEKPFVLNVEDGERLVELSEPKRLVTQVGYHYRFVGAFREIGRVARSGALGDIHHVRVEAYGPVVLRPKGGTWRLAKTEGGGCLYDYACHAVDLLGFVFEMPSAVSGVVMNKIFSSDVEDEVYCSLGFPNGASGQLMTNWSDESYRKMSAKIMLWGTKGRAVADRQECQVYLRDTHPGLPEYGAGWTVRYTTGLTEGVWYYLRGEEYSAQIDHFVRGCINGRRDGINNFRSALETDRVIAMVLAEHAAAAAIAGGQREASARSRRGVLATIFR